MVGVRRVVRRLRGGAAVSQRREDERSCYGDEIVDRDILVGTLRVPNVSGAEQHGRGVRHIDQEPEVSAVRHALYSGTPSPSSEKRARHGSHQGVIRFDPISANRKALMHPQVVERLTALLQIVGSRLRHVTMRQLVGFIAFLLSGGQ